MAKVQINGEKQSTESNKLLNENQPNPLITKYERHGNVSTKSRTILWHVTFWGFAINYMVRCNLNLAIVSIVVPRKASNNSLTESTIECFNSSFNSLLGNSTNGYQSGDQVKKYFSLERSIMDFFKIDYNEDGFEWTEYEQGKCLGSFYWLFWSTQLLGGYLANRFGTKLVFGMSNFLSCGLSFLIPMAAYSNLNFLLFVRTLQGAFSGFSWPAMHGLISQWIPPNERSRFMSAYMGSSVGVAVCYPIFSFIITTSSWEWVFHFCTVAAIVWFICWQYYVYDSPDKHPRIDSSELNYITESLGSSVQKDKNAIPWRSILTSFPFWMTTVANWGSVWQLYTLMIQLPTYFKFIHGFDIGLSGILSGGPHLLRVSFSIIFSAFVDYLLRSKTLSRTYARKFAVFVSCVLSGVLIIGLAYAGCNSNIAIVLTWTSIMLLGAQAAGVLSSFVDLAPNYSSVLLGISLTICTLPGILSSHIVGVLTNNQQTSEQWKYVFLIAAGMSILSGMVYVLFSSSDEQSWNKSSKSTEMKPLNEISNIKFSE